MSDDEIDEQFADIAGGELLDLDPVRQIGDNLINGNLTDSMSMLFDPARTPEAVALIIIGLMDYGIDLVMLEKLIVRRQERLSHG